MNITASIKPLDVLNDCEILNPSDKDYTTHPIINKYGSPQQPIYIDKNTVKVNGVKYDSPLIFPIYNARLELVQCGIVQDGQTVSLYPDGGLAKGFAYYGAMHIDKPVIVVYSLEAFFKVATTGYSVVLVMLSKLRYAHESKLKDFEFKQIEFIVNQLSKHGYNSLYMPVRPELINTAPFQQLQQNTAVKLINQSFDYCNKEYLVELTQDEDSEDVRIFLHESIAQQPQQSPTLSNGYLAKPFHLDNGEQVNILENGLYLIKDKKGDDGETIQTQTFICHSAIILGEARSQHNDNWKRVIQFKDKDHTQHTLLIPYEHFMGEAQEALKIIANHGLMPPRQTYKKNVFIQYIQDYPIEKRFRCVNQTGWHNQSFITPSKTYGHADDEELLFHYEGKNPYSTQGTFEGWQELSRLIEPHDLAVLSFSCAFAGQLIEPLGVESGGFHIYGSSTDGKSTITKASCSVWGNPKDISKSWRTTDNALENEAELRNDNFLNLDELRQAVPKAVSDIVYMLTGGQGKARSSKAGKNRDLKHFNLMYMSTGEVTLEEHLRRGNIELDAGLLLRFAHLPSDAGNGLGVFNSINYGTQAQDIGNRINELASQHYGHAGNQWLEYLTHDKQAVIDQAQKLFELFIAQQPSKLNGQASRVLRRFALVAVSGELATLAGITGWQKGRAFEAVQHCFNHWLSHFGHGGNLEERKILEHIKAFFEAHGNSRFESTNISRSPDGEVIRPRIQNQVGFYEPDTKTYLVSAVMFKKEMCIGINEANTKKVLKQHHWIDCDDGRYTKRVGRSVLPNGERPTMMHFRADIIQNFDNESLK